MSADVHPVLVEIEAWDRRRPRSQQVELGASDAFGCRAEAVLHLNGVPETDGRLRWDALVGTALHAVAEQAAPSTVLVERRFAYRGVWATIDRYDPATKTLTDLKSKDNAAKIRKVLRWGPSRQHVTQVNIGAAALQEAGYEVNHLELLYLPRVGEPSDARAVPVPLDRAIADDGVDWIEWAIREARSREGLPVADQVWGLQDENETFCRRYCAHVTACRGPLLAPVESAPVALEDVL